MSWFQKTFTLPPRSRGCYLITDHVASELPELRNYKVGLLHLFVQHTSCGLSLNENWDDDVRADMSDALDRLAPEDRKGNLYRHAAEGEDDMPVFFFFFSISLSPLFPFSLFLSVSLSVFRPRGLFLRGWLLPNLDCLMLIMKAHIKSSLVGASVTVPITNGRLNTGTWQGLYYMEFRASRHTRRVVATIQGEKA